MRATKLYPVANAHAGAIAVSPCALAACLLLIIIPSIILGQQEKLAPSQLTPFQLEVEKQRQRLASSETEERRDAVVRLGAMKRAESSRVAASALRDPSAIVRATAAHSVLSLPPDEAATLLLPLLQDREEFVRQETASALGETRSRTAVSALIMILEHDKKDSVRGAAAVALGLIGDETAVIPLSQLLGRRVPASGLINRVRRSKKDENEFVRRAAARSLGQIRSGAAVPALTAVLLDERAPGDVRREAATSLGLIGDPTVIPALRAVLTAHDPYLSRTAYESLVKIAPTEATQPTTDGSPRH
jgi:HEAT repeat protein